MINGVKISQCRGTPNNQNALNGRLTGFGTAKAQLKVGDQVQIDYWYRNSLDIHIPIPLLESTRGVGTS